MAPKVRDLKDRILERVDIEDRGYGTKCWISNRSQNGDGYTKLGVDGHTLATHRVAYTEWRGPIPDHLVPDHLCRQRACCNPWHLELVARRENVLRGDTIVAKNAAKTHCPKGHLLAGGNLTKQPGRACRTCANERHREASRRRRRAMKVSN